jgi:hypothetical protein
MKKIIFTFFIALTLLSCTQDVQFNNPAMQGLVDEMEWKAKDFSFTVDANQRLVIQGLSQFETITLKTSSINPGTYTLGTGTLNSANYTLSIDGTVNSYSTLNGGSGTVVIEESITNSGTLTGTFKFKAINGMGETLTISKGILYKVPQRE